MYNPNVSAHAVHQLELIYNSDIVFSLNAGLVCDIYIGICFSNALMSTTHIK